MNTTMNELDELKNIIDEITAPDVPTFTDTTAVDFVETMLEIMETYIKDNPKAVTEPDFQEDFKEHITELIQVTFENELMMNEEMENDLELMMEDAFTIFFQTIMPQRSFSETIILVKPDKPTIEKQLEYLRSKPQPAQRTQEWYNFRQNLITASNAYKAFENQTIKNQLIYEKCQPLKIVNQDPDIKTITMVNVNTTLHWGQKYEPLSVMIYEYLYNTKVGDFGCIQHDSYKFLGASPDGINIDPNSERYGRMLEIKNIVNREIDGIPKKEYWIQMQLQMEVCNLDECDFLETKFVEYESYADYKNEMQTEAETKTQKRTGIIMYFSSNEGIPLYIYKPLDITDEDEITEWEEKTLEKYQNSTMTWIRNIYWKLEHFSCVLVLRNKLWFSSNIHELQEIWSTIEEERQTGYEHRAPNKRIKKDNTTSNTSNQSYSQTTIPECLVSIDIASGKSFIVKKTNDVIKIRTQSFDEVCK
jgi:putative phage-type endonuclease